MKLHHKHSELITDTWVTPINIKNFRSYVEDLKPIKSSWDFHNSEVVSYTALGSL